MAWTEEQFAALSGKAPPKKKKQKVVLADGYTSNVKGWRNVGINRCYFKSLWEINYACYLEFLKQNGNIKNWEYEPRTFRFPKEDYDAGPYLYCPDFRVTENNGVTRWHEVKGWLNTTSKKKIKRFHKHHPKEGKILLIGKQWFAEASKKRLKNIIPGWESLKDIKASKQAGKRR